MRNAILKDPGNSFPEPDIALVIMRMGVAAIFGAVTGIVRQRRLNLSGMRNVALISLGARRFARVTCDLPDDTGRQFHGAGSDPLRLHSAETSGMAFPGTGSIILASGRGRDPGAEQWPAPLDGGDGAFLRQRSGRSGRHCQAIVARPVVAVSPVGTAPETTCDQRSDTFAYNPPGRHYLVCHRRGR